MQKNKRKKNLFNIIIFLVSITILIYFCVDNNNLLILIENLDNLNYTWLIISVICMFASWYFDSKMFYCILNKNSNKIYSIFDALKITMTGVYFGSITPFGVAGNPMQVLKLTELNINAGKAISILVQKFLVFQTALSSYFLIIILFKFNLFSEKIPGFVFFTLIGFLSQCILIVILALFYLNKKFVNNIIKFLIFLLYKIKIIKNPEKIRLKIENQLDFFIKNSNFNESKKFKLYFKLFLYAFLEFTFLFSIPFFVYKAFNGDGFPYIDMICTQAFVTMISSYTPLPGAAGTTESSFVILFSNFFNSNLINPAMIMYRFISYYFSILISFVFIKINFNKKINKKIK